MNTHQADDVIAGYRKATDAQQDVIRGLLAEIDRLQAGGCARNQGSTQFCAEAVMVEEKFGAMQRHVELCRQIVKCPDDETLAEWLKGSVRLDDPVVTGLVEALRYVFHERLPLGNTVSDHLFEENLGRWESINEALSAYEARVKEVGK